MLLVIYHVNVPRMGAAIPDVMVEWYIFKLFKLRLYYDIVEIHIIVSFNSYGYTILKKDETVSCKKVPDFYGNFSEIFKFITTVINM